MYIYVLKSTTGKYIAIKVSMKLDTGSVIEFMKDTWVVC